MNKMTYLSAITDTKSSYPANQTVQELFEEQATRNYHKTALVHNGKRMTYGMLNEQINRVARFLRKKGIRAETVVAVMLNQGINRIVAILAVIKAGGAYLPLDKEYPVGRIRYMLKDSDVKLTLTDEDIGIETEIEQVRIDKTDFSEYIETNINIANNSSNLMYIIYTSGSTGKPKGVMVEQQNVVRLVRNTNYIDFHENDKMLQGSSIQFDASTFELWGALLNGLELHLIEKEMLIDAEALETYFNQEKITIAWMTSPLFNSIAEQNPKLFQYLNYLLVGGDALSPKHIEWVRTSCPGVQIINGYGPTENTTFSTYFVVNKTYEMNIPIGKPISNSTAFIMDEKLHILPIGEVGELCVGGDGVARGYLNRTELTKEKFITHEKFGRIYRTGDLAKMLPDGNIEFVGRVDNQVKIRGFRIELNEIERVVTSHPDINETVVLVHGDHHEKNLQCYYKAKKKVRPKELRTFLLERLPEHMIPTKLMQIDQFPFNSSGKIDRNQLLNLKEKVEIIPGKENETISERNIVEICKDVLRLSTISVHDNFFDLGLDSLSASKLLNKMRKELNVSLKIRDIFENNTATLLAKVVETSAPLSEEVTVVSEEQNYYEVSSAQKRMYLSDLSKEDYTYHIPFVVYFKEKIDVAQLQQALLQLISRHEVLRTTFHFIDESIYQQVNESVDLTIAIEQENKDILTDQNVQEYLSPFDLEKGPLLRASVISMKNNQQALLIDTHHAVFDGISVQIFIDELIELYHGRELQQPYFQYKDFARWHNQKKRSDDFEDMRNYWLNKFSPLPNLPVLPYRIGGTLPSQESNFIDMYVDKEIIDAAKDYLNDTQSSLYMFFISILGLQLAKYSKEEDVVLTSVADSRDLAEFQQMIGMFVDTFPLRLQVKKGITFQDLLISVRQMVMEAQENKYPYEAIVEEIANRSNKKTSDVLKLFNIMFVLDTRIKTDQELIKGVHPLIATGTAKFDLTFAVLEVESSYQFRVEFDPKLFDRKSMKVFLNHYIELLSYFAYHPKQFISSYELTDVQEMNLSRKMKTSMTTETTFKVPTTKIEEILSEVWCEVLSLEIVGTTDRFLEIGGDSIKAIQIASRLQKRGLKLKVNHILQEQTIEKISPYVTERTVQRDNRLIEGTIPLTPIQQWFFDKNMLNNNHFNQSMVWKSINPLKAQDVKRAFEKLVEHHDMLRAKFTNTNGVYTQYVTGLHEVNVEVHSYSLQEEEDIERQINSLGKHYQLKLDIEKGELIQIVVVHGTKESYLLVILHHLVIDEVSWHVLLEDFTYCYEQLQAKHPIQLPDKTDSYQSYSEQLITYANEGHLLEEKVYWDKVLKHVQAYNSGEKVNREFPYKKSKDIHISLNEENTQILLKDANQVYHTQIQDLLLAALALTVNRQINKSSIAFDVESHGRESLFEHTDVNRTVGWFTSIYPVAIRMNEVEDVNDTIIQMKESLRNVPLNGIGYGLIRYILQDPAYRQDRPKICFNYLGVINESKQNQPFVISSIKRGPEIGEDYKTDYYLEINCQVIHHQLEIILTINELEFSNVEAEKLAEDYKHNILRVINHCMTKEEAEMTPSDLSSKEINQEFMDEIFEALKNQ